MTFDKKFSKRRDVQESFRNGASNHIWFSLSCVLNGLDFQTTGEKNFLVVQQSLERYLNPFHATKLFLYIERYLRHQRGRRQHKHQQHNYHHNTCLHREISKTNHTWYNASNGKVNSGVRFPMHWINSYEQVCTISTRSFRRAIFNAACKH